MAKVYNKRNLKPIRRALRHSMSKAEVLLWSELKGKQLLGFKFRRQFSIDDFVVDFYCPGLKLAIEIDGETHGTESELAYDRARQAHIEQYSITVLRFTNLDVFESFPEVIDTIVEKIKLLSNPHVAGQSPESSHSPFLPYGRI